MAMVPMVGIALETRSEPVDKLVEIMLKYKNEKRRTK